MNFMFGLLITVMFVAYIVAFVWRRRISKKENDFETKMSMAGDDSYIQDRLNQISKNKES